MREREDVAKFLRNRSDTCLDLVEGGGVSIRQLMMTSAITPGKVSRVLNKHVAKQVRKEERKEMSRDHCLNCQTEKAALHCSNCFSVACCSKKCQKHHWKRHHKNEC